MKGAAMIGMGARNWRRLERRARAAHEAETLSVARRLCGAVALTVEAVRPGILRLCVGEWQVILAGAATAGPPPGSGWVRMDAAGRYGRWWWLRLVHEGGAVTVLGSLLQVRSIGDGGMGESPLDSPAGGEWILLPCEYGCR